MKEWLQSPDVPEPFWQADRAIGRVHLWGDTYDLALRTHTLTLPASRTPDLVPTTPGPRTYLRGQAYIVEPWPAVPAALRGIRSPELAELERVRVGDVQAFYYPTDRVLVLRDCALLMTYREAEPRLDPNHRALWQGTEETLLARFPAATQIVTPAVPPGYDRADYAPFLDAMGYARLSRSAYGRTLLPEP
jgi:hypothetical protein